MSLPEWFCVTVGICEGQSHLAVSHQPQLARRTEAYSNCCPSIHQSSALPLGQTTSLTFCWLCTWLYSHCTRLFWKKYQNTMSSGGSDAATVQGYAGRNLGTLCLQMDLMKVEVMLAIVKVHVTEIMWKMYSLMCIKKFVNGGENALCELCCEDWWQRSWCIRKKYRNCGVPTFRATTSESDLSSGSKISFAIPVSNTSKVGCWHMSISGHAAWVSVIISPMLLFLASVWIPLSCVVPFLTPRSV